MTCGKEALSELRQLVTESIEGTACPEQIARLCGILSSSAQARRYYLEYIDIHVLVEHLCSDKLLFDDSESTVEDEVHRQDMLLKALALEERCAETITVDKPKPRAEKPVIHNLPHVDHVRKIQRSSIISLAVSAAAMLRIVLFVRYAPPKLGYEIATINDSIDAKWGEGVFLPVGSRLATSYTPVALKEGFVQLRFDSGVDVVIEAPAEFHIISDDQMKLNYGRLFADVPRSAIGFTVSSQGAKVIDLGTEFGIYSVQNGGLELHVLEGKTLLFAEDHGGMTSLEVGEGMAKRISPDNILTDIPCNKRMFARRINSQDNMVWRGQKYLDLTDMVIGGDGQSKHRSMGKLDVRTGRRTGELFVGTLDENPGFQPVSLSPFIDGVFVPNRGDGDIISTTGLRFEGCPETSGSAFYHISTIPDVPGLGSSGAYSLALTENGSAEPGIMLLHANTGITYDLEAIRRHYRGWQIMSFATGCGFPASLRTKWAQAPADDLIRNAEAGTVSFYVLVDGHIRRHMSFRIASAPQTLQIELSDQDRFLTLISTDSDRRNYYDWLVLENPVLVLEE